MAISEADRRRYYGHPGHVDTRIVTTPWGPRTSIHVKLADHFLDTCQAADLALIDARSKWRPRRIDGYNPRPIRGSSEWSIHAWASAVDCFSTEPGVPPPGGVWTPDDPPPIVFVKAFEDAGWTWGGRWGRKDEPHFEWNHKPPAKSRPVTPTEDIQMQPFFATSPRLRDGSTTEPHERANDLLFVVDGTSFHMNDEEDIRFWARKAGIPAPLPLTEERKKELAVPSQVFSDLWARRVKP